MPIFIRLHSDARTDKCDKPEKEREVLSDLKFLLRWFSVLVDAVLHLEENIDRKGMSELFFRPFRVSFTCFANPSFSVLFQIFHPRSSHRGRTRNRRRHRRWFSFSSETKAFVSTWKAIVSLYPISVGSSCTALESLDEAREGAGDGDEGTLLFGPEGDGSSESGTDNERRIFSSISPIKTNEGSTMY